MATINQCLTKHKDNPEQLKALAYLRHIAAMTNADINRWNISGLFGENGNSEDDRINTDKNAINKIFFQKYQEVIEKKNIDTSAPLAEEVPELQEAVLKAAASNLEYRAQGLRRSIEQHLASARTYNERVKNQLEHMHKCKQELMMLEGGDYATVIKNKLNEALSSGYWVNPVVHNNHLYLNTRNKIIISHENKSAGLDIKLDVGYLAVKINLRSFDMMVIPYKNNIRYENYFHPHVDHNGQICWGDAYNSVAKWREQFEIGKILQILYSLLQNYNPENPYVSVESMHAYHTKYGRCSEELKHPDKMNLPAAQPGPTVEVVRLANTDTNDVR